MQKVRLLIGPRQTLDTGANQNAFIIRRRPDRRRLRDETGVRAPSTSIETRPASFERSHRDLQNDAGLVFRNVDQTELWCGVLNDGKWYPAGSLGQVT